MSITARVRARLARQRARWWLRPHRAVILDTETTDFDGEIIEISIVDAASGKTLLDTLVQPLGPICPEASAVHGITDDMCRSAPRWTEVGPKVCEILGRHQLALAYNAPFDRRCIEADCRRHHLPVPTVRWRCVMRLDAAARQSRRWRRLDAGHRAHGDTLAARDLLCAIAAK